MQPLLVLAILSFVIPAAAPLGTFPVGDPPAAGAGISFSDGCGGGPGTCMFVAIVSDPNLVLFRWDFDGDGRWDTGTPSDPWIMNLVLFHTFDRGGTWVVCLQGWDGITTRYEAPYYYAVGPTICRTRVLGGSFFIGPNSWDRASSGRVGATWELPPDFLPETDPAQQATVGGVPAIPLPSKRFFGESFARFTVNREALTAALGPGTHYVMLTGTWGDVVFSADGEVTIT